MKTTRRPEHVTRMIAERELDDAIDRTVREITSVEPMPGLDRRVRARLNERRERRIVTWPRLAAAGLAAAAVIAFAITMSRAPMKPTSDVIARAPQPVAPQVDHGPVVVAPPTAPSPTRRVASVPQRATHLVRAASVTDTDTTVTVPALDAIAPIEVSPVEPESMHMSRIAIEPIQVAPLRVEPLSTTPH